MRDADPDYDLGENRSRLKSSGYTLCWEAGLWTEDAQPLWWEKTISRTRRTARRDHKNGRIKAGDQYWEIVTRIICDSSGASFHSRTIHRINHEDHHTSRSQGNRP